jgi:alanine dehydrogenase
MRRREPMKVGCVKEIKRHEYRVGMTPTCVQSYVAHGHKVLIEAEAGAGAGFEDAEYMKAGATIEKDRKKIFDTCDMIVKVKEPQPEEYEMLHEGQILFTYLHLAADEEQLRGLLKRKIKGVAYETIRLSDGTLPCLKPMSEIAGRLSVQEGAKYLEKPFGGRGVLLGGVPGVPRGKVSILGGGVVGTNAAKVAVGMGAEVTVLDVNPNRLAYLDDIFRGALATLYATEKNIQTVVEQSDLVIGAVLIPGAQAPHLIRREHLKLMKKRSVIVDVAVDQGGCVETTRPTTHDNPTFEVDGIVHYCVANMPGAVALTSTLALTSSTLPYGLKIADLGLEEACRKNPDLKEGLNLYEGKCTYPGVAKAFNLACVSPDSLL